MLTWHAAMTNVFKIRHGKETHVYRTETAADKKNLLTQFRLIAEELAAKKRKEREGEHIRRKSLWNGGDVRLLVFLYLINNPGLGSALRSHMAPSRCLQFQIGWPIWLRSLT